MKKWMPIKEFARKHEIKYNSLYVGRTQGQFPDSAFKKTLGNSMLVDENFFNRRIEFRKRIWLKSHDNFYFLTKHISSWELSSYLSKIDPTRKKESWSTFLNGDLFSVPPTTITYYKTSDMLYKFYRYSRWLIRAVFIYHNKFVQDRQRIIEKILDS